jgi:hypothetical protein
MDHISSHFGTAYYSNIYSHFRPIEIAPDLAHFGEYISKMHFFCINYQISKTHCLFYIDEIGSYISIADLIKKTGVSEVVRIPALYSTAQTPMVLFHEAKED